MPHATVSPATDTDLRHEYARHAATVATLRQRLLELREACGGEDPVGFCDVCGAVLFPRDRPAVGPGDAVTCGREAPGGDPAAPCFYRPNHADGS